MRTLFKIMIVGFMGLAGLFPAGAEEGTGFSSFELSPCFMDGMKGRVLCASVNLPLDYKQPEGAKVPVHVLVLPAVTANPAKDPLLIFAGGPGQAASDLGLLVQSAFHQVHNNRDIVLIDQRGTGKSYGLQCDFDDLDTAFVEPAKAVKQCRAQYDIDVRHFTLENVIRDTDEIRARLGYEQLNLWGGSYGTKSISLYLKRYPERVRAVIVDGVLPPDSLLFASTPKSAERSIGKLIVDCQAQASCHDVFPNFEEQIEALLERAVKGGLVYKGTDPVSGKYIEQDFNFEMAVESIRSVLYSSQGTTILPYIVNEAYNGNLAPLVASMLNGAGMSKSMYLGATLSILCGSDVERMSADDAMKAGEGSFARDSYFRFWRRNCDGWDYINPPAPDFSAPIKSDVPALVLSGDLDPITPPQFGAHWAKGFPNSRHIILAGTGHGTSTVGCMPAIIGEFVDTLDLDALDTSCLDHLSRLPLVVSSNGNVQ